MARPVCAASDGDVCDLRACFPATNRIRQRVDVQLVLQTHQRPASPRRAATHQACSQASTAMIDDDELEDVGVYLAHDWELEGVREIGGKLRRCRRCGVLQHWPAAESSCSSVLLHQPAGDVAQGPLHDGQWTGPYAAGTLPTCVVCSRAFRRPVMNTLGKTCSLACAAENKRLANRRARLAAKARKA